MGHRHQHCVMLMPVDDRIRKNLQGSEGRRNTQKERQSQMSGGDKIGDDDKESSVRHTRVT